MDRNEISDDAKDDAANLLLRLTNNKKGKVALDKGQGIVKA